MKTATRSLNGWEGESLGENTETEPGESQNTITSRISRTKAIISYAEGSKVIATAIWFQNNAKNGYKY